LVDNNNIEISHCVPYVSFVALSSGCAELVGRRVWSHLLSSQYLATEVTRRHLAHLSVHLYSMTSPSANVSRLAVK